MSERSVSIEGQRRIVQGKTNSGEEGAEGPATKIIQAGKHDAVEVPLRTGAGGGGSGGGAPGELTASPMSREESERRAELDRMEDESSTPNRPR